MEKYTKISINIKGERTQKEIEIRYEGTQIDEMYRQRERESE